MKTNFYAKISQISKTGKYTTKYRVSQQTWPRKAPLLPKQKSIRFQIATDILEGIFWGCISNSEPIPSQTVNSTTGLEPVTIDNALAFLLWLGQERAKKKLSQSQAAKLLSISTLNYQHLELPKRCNPTLRTIIKILDYF